MNCEGFKYIRGALSPSQQYELVQAVQTVVAKAPYFKPTMPKTGKPFSVRMTNAGPLGWVSDKASGYRYQAMHPVTGKPWPAIPALLLRLWREHAGYPATPEACLINHYEAGARMGSHQDRDEQDLEAPVLSVSLGDDAVFHVGGSRRLEPKSRVTLKSGDVVVLAGKSRLAYHGIDRIFFGSSALLAEGGRINLTLRRVTKVVSPKG